MNSNKNTVNQDAVVVPKRRRLKRTFLLVACVAVVIVLALVVSWHFMIPDTARLTSGENPKAVPGSLNAADVKEIARLCRGQTVGWVFARLRKGELVRSFDGMRALFKQKIDRLADDRDGTYRGNIVIYDQKESDGFYAWSRYKLTKTNGHWKVLYSY